MYSLIMVLTCTRCAGTQCFALPLVVKVGMSTLCNSVSGPFDKNTFLLSVIANVDIEVNKKD